MYKLRFDNFLLNEKDDDDDESSDFMDFINQFLTFNIKRYPQFQIAENTRQ